MITQLSSPLPMSTPRGPALAHFVIDYGIETDLFWVCFLQSSGECWTFHNSEIRMEWNSTVKRTPPAADTPEQDPEPKYLWVLHLESPLGGMKAVETYPDEDTYNRRLHAVKTLHPNGRLSGVGRIRIN